MYDYLTLVEAYIKGYRLSPTFDPRLVKVKCEDTTVLWKSTNSGVHFAVSVNGVNHVEGVSYKGTVNLIAISSNSAVNVPSYKAQSRFPFANILSDLYDMRERGFNVAGDGSLLDFCKSLGAAVKFSETYMTYYESKK